MNSSILNEKDDVLLDFWLNMKQNKELKLNLLYSSTPDIGNTIFKRSKLKKNCKYIYLQHSPVSLTMIYREKAFENFDAIQVISKFQESEINEMKTTM